MGKITDQEKQLLRLFKSIPNEMAKLIRDLKEMTTDGSGYKIFSEMFEGTQQEMFENLEKVMSPKYQKLNFLANIVLRLSNYRHVNLIKDKDLFAQVKQPVYNAFFSVVENKINESIKEDKFKDFIVLDDYIRNFIKKIVDITGEEFEVPPGNRD